MKKSNKKIPKSHLPKYKGGGLGMVGKDLKNTGLFLVDMGLAEWAPNAITQDQYSDTKYGANLGKIDSMNESFSSQSPIRKNVSKMWTDDRSSGMNEEQQKAFNQVQPIAKVGSSIGEMWTTKGLSGIGQGSTNATGEFQPSQANGFAKSLGDLSQAGTKNYTPNMYDNNAQTTVEDLNNSRRASMYAMGGINMQPNAEVEGNEMITSNTSPQLQSGGNVKLASNNPYGTPTYKTEGLSHEQGGMPMNIAPGSIINGKTKNPLTGNKFTKDIDIITKQENKFTKHSEKGGVASVTSELMLKALAFKKDSFNKLQNAIIANKQQAKNLAKGILSDNESMEQGQSEVSEGEFAMGGVKLPMYSDGGPVDSLGVRVNTLPSDNFKFSHKVGNKDVYVDPGNMQRAYEGSSKTKDTEGYNNFLRMKMASGISPDELVKQGYATTTGISQLKGSYNPKYVHMESFGQPSTTPSNTQAPYDQRIDRKEVSQNMSTDVNYYDYPDANAGYSKATRVAFDRNSGREIDPMKSYDPKGNYTPYFNLNTGRDLYKNTIKSSIPGTNPTNLNLNNQGDIRKEATQSTSFKYGGRKLPKYAWGDLTPEQLFLKTKFMGAEQNQRNLAFNQMTGNTNPGFSTYNSDYQNALQQTRDEVANSNKQNQIPQEEELQLANDVIDKQHGWNHNDPTTKPKSKNPNSRNFDWQGLANNANNAGNFALQNAGNIYDLTRKQDPLQKYARATAKYITPDFRDANQKYLWAKNALAGVSGGNAGTALSNIQQAHVNNVMNKAQIQQTADNTNAQIANQNSQFNTEIAYREAEAQAKDRAMRQNVNSQAIHNMASNFGKFSKSSKEDNMDQDELSMFQWRYKNEPGFREHIDKFSTSKKSKGSNS